MTTSPTLNTAMGKPANRSLSGLRSATAGLVRRVASVARGFVRTVALTFVTVAKAFEMAHVEPFAGRGPDHRQNR